ncbi:MAG TPA: hypothetical protein VF070_43515, partial [Streptosporangiaceae bacterium]
TPGWSEPTTSITAALRLCSDERILVYLHVLRFDHASQALRSLWKMAEKIRGFFADPNLAYISRAYAALL